MVMVLAPVSPNYDEQLEAAELNCHSFKLISIYPAQFQQKCYDLMAYVYTEMLRFLLRRSLRNPTRHRHQSWQEMFRDLTSNVWASSHVY